MPDDVEPRGRADFYAYAYEGELAIVRKLLTQLVSLCREGLPT